MRLIPNPKVYSLWLGSDVHGSAQTIRLRSSITIENGVCQSTMTENTLSFVLEAAQAGLSWSIVLKKREGYRGAF
jgi:hypothetical protein